jgi:hypothetical protein
MHEDPKSLSMLAFPEPHSCDFPCSSLSCVPKVHTILQFPKHVPQTHFPKFLLHPVMFYQWTTPTRDSEVEGRCGCPLLSPGQAMFPSQGNCLDDCISFWAGMLQGCNTKARLPDCPRPMLLMASLCALSPIGPPDNTVFMKVFGVT